MRIESLVVLASAALIAAACTDDGEAPPPSVLPPIGGAPPAPTPTPAPAPSPYAPTWTEVYGEIISTRCLPCHSTLTGASLGKLDMATKDDAYENLVGRPAEGYGCVNRGARVVSTNHTVSILYLKVSLEDSVCGSKMPLDAEPLTADQVTKIAQWIDDGAQND